MPLSPTGDAMKKRSRVAGEPIKGRRRKTAGPKRRNAPKTMSRPNASRSEKPTEVVRLARELNEALERQTATSEVLNVISSSSGELDPVFNAILQNAARICQAQFGTLNLYDGTAYRRVALRLAISTVGTATPFTSSQRSIHPTHSPTFAGVRLCVPVPILTILLAAWSARNRLFTSPISQQSVSMSSNAIKGLLRELNLVE